MVWPPGKEDLVFEHVMADTGAVVLGPDVELSHAFVNKMVNIFDTNYIVFCFCPLYPSSDTPPLPHPPNANLPFKVLF